MFTKKYKYELSRGYGELIEAILNRSPKLNEIFYDFPAGFGWFLRKPLYQTCEELKKKDSLISNVYITFSYNLIEMILSFNMIVTVNASFMPDEVDNICQEYFDDLIEFINKRFEVKDGIMMTDEQAYELAMSIKREVSL